MQGCYGSSTMWRIPLILLMYLPQHAASISGSKRTTPSPTTKLSSLPTEKEYRPAKARSFLLWPWSNSGVQCCYPYFIVEILSHSCIEPHGSLGYVIFSEKPITVEEWESKYLEIANRLCHCPFFYWVLIFSVGF